MSMFTNIVLVENYFLEGMNMRAIGRNDKPTLVFARQGHLDGSCCIYSLMMMLIIHGLLEREDLTDLRRGEENSFVDSIQRVFLYDLKGFCVGGHSLSEISDKLNECSHSNLSNYFTLKPETENTVSRRDLHKKIRSVLYERFPVMLAYRKKNGEGHAVVAIGYYMDGPKEMRLLCLDPSQPLNYLSFWNNIIKLDFMSRDKENLTDYNCYYCNDIIVDEILTINWREYPF